MNDRTLRALFASVIATTAAAVPIACHRDQATPDVSNASQAVSATPSASAPAESSTPAFTPFHCPPPRVVSLEAGLPDVGTADVGPAWGDGGLPSGLCRDMAVCGPRTIGCILLDASLPTQVQCATMCMGGRRPEGYAARDGGAGGIAGWLASLAALEAASVPAFRRMARELARHGAPRRMVRACERAAREEIRHARGAHALGRRFGAPVLRSERAKESPRALERFAAENAVEGCVRETYAALVATWQADHAQDPRVRVHFARIAREETRHAALAHRVDAWARARLGRDARARVDSARRAARDELTASLAHEPEAALTRLAGLPDAATAQRLAAALDGHLILAARAGRATGEA